MKLVLTDQDGRKSQPIAKSRLAHSEKISGGVSHRVDLRRSTRHRMHSGRELGVSVAWHSSPASGLSEAAVTLHNPAAANHPEGLWDLGDPASVLLRAVQVEITVPEHRKVHLAIDEQSEPRPLACGYSLTQWSSGGDNWQSRVHRDASGQIPLKQRGFSLTDGESVLAHGDRATPTLYIDLDNTRLAIAPCEFWQQFPMRVERHSDRIIFSLYAEDCAGVMELQGGEKKTWRLCWQPMPTGSTDRIAKLYWTPEPRHIASCKLEELGDLGSVDPRLTTILTAGLSCGQSLLSKRDAIDEYGWRNFGELYADHENDLCEDEDYLISHYNNQYDPLFGLLRLYLATGEWVYFELADDLARHLRDIDIYHTNLDRPEYNQGLFWHTDHYLDAGTSTHRSYSRMQPSNAYEGHARGGGPGGQHCYTTGLLLHYLITGEAASRDCLFGLVTWVTHVYEGSGTMVDWVLALRNRHRGDLRDPLHGMYPLDRGTGNYLMALLDLYYLQQCPTVLRQIENIIAATVHPEDDLTGRDLDNVEQNWFYTIFLQALSRYLEVKSAEGDDDSAFCYGRDALLHYAKWMADHENPYLCKPEELEFPNATWVAQDLRKARVLASAARLARTPELRERLRRRAQEFEDYVLNTLKTEPTTHYTRIQAILMQNLAPPMPIATHPETLESMSDTPPLAKRNFMSAAAFISGRLLLALRSFSLRREWHGLTSRFPALRRSPPHS
ncbi:hypothetical protein R0135_07670 [Congregibacter variabilis]|uniref:Uncharacterized protein n=1 Tax=Congregibacter variabilis TaxID=3081200 RepID=A0ABZ0I695_9GAMM|nr:hypothetical protein R0135_07670 [Congregibacter sp. IMCC43200]